MRARPPDVRDPVLAAVALVLLLGLFSGAIAINLIRGRTDIDCGCFGPVLRQKLSGWLLLRNLALIVLAAAVALPEASRSIHPLDGVTIAFGAATLTMLYVSANYAIGNLAATRALEGFE